MYFKKPTLSSQGIEFIDPGDKTGKLRQWIKINADDNESLGNQPVGRSWEQIFVLKKSWRSLYMMVPPTLELSCAELVSWYSIGTKPNDTIHVQDTSTRLPDDILLTDQTTLLRKNTKQKILLTPSVVGYDAYENKLLFNFWRDEEDIERTDLDNKDIRNITFLL